MCNEEGRSDSGLGGLAWVSAACTLPSTEQPLRVAEFDMLFATALRGVQRPAPDRLRLLLDPDVEVVARELTARESECCSFFTFTVTATAAAVLVDVTVPGGQVAVLDELAGRATARAGLAA